MNLDIKNTLLEYDKIQEEINLFLEKVYYIEINKYDNEKNNILFLNKNKDVLLDSEFEYMGIYKAKTNKLHWAWSIPSINKKDSIYAKRIFDWAFDKIFIDFLKHRFLSPEITILNNYQLDINSAIISLITKKKFIFPFVLYNDEKLEDIFMKREYNNKNYREVKFIINFKEYQKILEENTNYTDIQFLYILDYN